ncbi:tyrosine-type recombinase/integrase [Pseudomonas sessilinigenes]|uniref:Tyrosine-type recombinase/integrase n=1 Tax=Pseudomonas sessilinigenes TaxID=658629 RepID=A0ABX8MIB6_9PSED|nr:tyrosine-type recombinase/integrase [Pseudomonas sessilinigenes]QXH37884.1 tyrosine-type recombinase/integrase [Pseudomonas sessilinigenes]
MSELTLAEGLQRYQEKVSVLKKGYVQETYRLAQLKRSALAAKTMREIKSPDIAEYRDLRLGQTNPRTGRLISSSTVRLEMSLLSNVFDVGRIEWGVCESNPVEKVRKPKAPPGRDRRLTPREERRILRYCHGHPTHELYSIVLLAIESAMRQGELLNLRWEHVNLRSRIAHLPDTKNGSKRDVPLSIKARDALIRLGVKTSGRIFNYTNNGLKSAWRIMVLRLEIPDLHFHDLRHEACSRLFELGTLDVMEIAAISGHKSLAMLKRYTHLKATNLVKKLEGNKHRGQQVVLNHLVPYPAVAQKTSSGVTIRVLDFDSVEGQGATPEDALRSAQDALLRHLMLALRDRRPIPAPDQYLEQVREADIIMLDPLCLPQNLAYSAPHTFF